MLDLPPDIKNRIKELRYEPDTLGMSESSILLFDDMILKVSQESEESSHEIAIMKWLKGRLPVPDVICHEKWKGKEYLLMSRMPGVVSCDQIYLENPEALTTVLAEGLKMLWEIELSECTFNCDLDIKLEMARYNVEHDLVDLDNVEPETFGENGFRDPAHLLSWLVENRPPEEIVFSHGDYCLPNLFVRDGKVSGFIDLGKAGRADKYQDIALCYRSLIHNFDGHYGGKVYKNFDPNLLFEKLGIEPDWKKIRYYILMDELF